MFHMDSTTDFVNITLASNDGSGEAATAQASMRRLAKAVATRIHKEVV